MIELPPLPPQRKKSTKRNVNLYIEKDTWSDFSLYCRINNTSASPVIEEIMGIVLENKIKDITKIKEFMNKILTKIKENDKEVNDKLI